MKTRQMIFTVIFSILIFNAAWAIVWVLLTYMFNAQIPFEKYMVFGLFFGFLLAGLSL